MKQKEELIHPCVDKKCWWCCDPVKVNLGFNRIPKDSKGNDIWVREDEIWIPHSNPDTVKVAIYKCLNYDQETKKCLDYDNRPTICHNSWCIDPNSKHTRDKQHKNLIETEFYKCKYPVKWEKK